MEWLLDGYFTFEVILIWPLFMPSNKLHYISKNPFSFGDIRFNFNSMLKFDIRHISIRSVHERADLWIF